MCHGEFHFTKKWLRIRLMAILQYASLTILFVFEHFLMTTGVPMTFWGLRRVQIYFHTHTYTYTPHCEPGPDFSLSSNTAISFTVRIAMCAVSCIIQLCVPHKKEGLPFPQVLWSLGSSVEFLLVTNAIIHHKKEGLIFGKVVWSLESSVIRLGLLLVTNAIIHHKKKGLPFCQVWHLSLLEAALIVG